MSEQLLIIAGPCSVESKSQIEEIYSEIENEIDIFRGGAYKPRTSVHSFQGLGTEGLQILEETSEKPVASEIMDTRDIEYFKNIEYVQIGARNMQNFSLLRAVGEAGYKVILKRGLSSTIEEFKAASEYLIHYGAKEVILCERGIRTISDSSRFTIDFAGVLKLQAETNMKVIVDVSHPAGNTEMISSLARAAVALGADGVMIEVHNDPCNALSDADQQIKPQQFLKITKELRSLDEYIRKLEK